MSNAMVISCYNPSRIGIFNRKTSLMIYVYLPSFPLPSPLMVSYNNGSLTRDNHVLISS